MRRREQVVFGTERTESSRLMRGARIPADEYLPEQRPQRMDVRQRIFAAGGDLSRRRRGGGRYFRRSMTVLHETDGASRL